MSRMLIVASLCVLATLANGNKVEHHVPSDGSVHAKGFKFTPTHKPTHAPTPKSEKCVDMPFGHYKQTCSQCSLNRKDCVLSCGACVTNEAGLLIPQPLTVYSSYSMQIIGSYSLDMTTCKTNHVANVNGVLVCETKQVDQDLGIIDDARTQEQIEQDNNMFLAIMGFFLLTLIVCCVLNPNKSEEEDAAASATASGDVKEPPSFCFKFLCPPCAVVAHEGCGIPALLSCLLGFLYTVFCWTPAVIAKGAAGVVTGTASAASAAAGTAVVKTAPGAVEPVAAASSGLADGGGATGEHLVFDDYFYKFCACCVPLCCRGQSRNEVFRERGMAELRSKKLELHLNNKMVVNVAPEYKPSYWSDMFYYVFQKDHFLSCLYCDHEHPFTKKERWMVYFTICCSVVMISTACRPPSDCEAWLNPKDPAYPKMHTWGRYDAGWTRFCESGMSPPNANLLAIIVAAIIKVTYGMILMYVAECPCFVDYVGTFKDRTESVGRAILWVAFFLGFVELYIGAKVIMASPFKMEMVTACINSIIVGIVTGWLTYWAMYHFYRVRQTGCKETNHRCCQGVDQDGDGAECSEVVKSMRGAWKSQQDTRAYDNPDDNDNAAAKAKLVPTKDNMVAKTSEGSFL